MNTEAIKCPACGGSLRIDDSAETTVCTYCGTTVRLTWRKPKGGNIIDSTTGMTIGSVKLPQQYAVSGRLRPEISCNVFPIGVSVTALDKSNNFISSFIGEAFQDISHCPVMKSYENTALTQISKVKYRNFQYAEAYADGYMARHAQSIRASSFAFVGNKGLPLNRPFDMQDAQTTLRRKTETEIQSLGGAQYVRVLGYYVKPVCRVYDITAGEKQFKAAITVTMTAAKYQVLIGGGMGGMFGLGSLFGGNPQAAQMQPGGDEFAYLPPDSVIDWTVSGIHILRTSPESFETEFAGAFTDFCSTITLDPELLRQMQQAAQQTDQNVRSYTQQQINQQNQWFAAQQQAYRTRQAAIDAANSAWWDRTQASDAARRASYQSQMAAEDRMSDRYSEAVRGVNTYVRPDGTEVEVSVSYDRAYANYSGDVLGSNSAFEPGGDWQEMQKK